MTTATWVQNERDRARRNVDWFIRRFDEPLREPYLDLACHAALPLVLTPELLHDLRITFLHGKAPQNAEADLLLSDLCHQVGNEQYTMDTSVRAYLVGMMRKRAGVKRMQDVARRLIQYVQQLARTSPWVGRYERQSQQWAAMVYLEDQRDEVVDGIARGILSCIARREDGSSEINDEAELLWLSDIVVELVPQLNQYRELVWYAEIVGRILTGESIAEGTPQDMLHQPCVIGDVMLPPLATIFPPTTSSSQEQPRKRPIVRSSSITGGVQTLGEQIDSLDAYVVMLGLLYALWANCYSGLMLEVKHFSIDEMSHDNVRRYAQELDRTVSHINEILETTALATEAQTWVLDLVQAQDLIRKALVLASSTQLRRAINLVGHVLDRQPIQLSSQFEQAAKALQLADVISGLQDRRADIDQADLDRFEDGISQLERLRQQLFELIREHTIWQRVDPDLRRIEESLEQSSNDLTLLWPHVKATAEPIYRERTEEWAYAIRDVSDKLDRALETQDLARTTSCFRNYQARAGNRLYRVINELKDIVDDLRRVDQQLADMLGKVE